MPFGSIAYLTFVVSAFTLLAATLAYAEWATRHADHPVRKPEQLGQEKPPRSGDSDGLRKAA